MNQIGRYDLNSNVISNQIGRIYRLTHSMTAQWSWFLIHLFSLHTAVMQAYCICCAMLRELFVVFVTLWICKNLPTLSMRKNKKNLKKPSLPIFQCQHTVTLATGKGNAVRVGELSTISYKWNKRDVQNYRLFLVPVLKHIKQDRPMIIHKASESVYCTTKRC